MVVAIGEWEDGKGEFVAKVCDGLSASPAWTLPYEARRAVSKEERVVRQVAAEHAWNGTLVEGFWRRLRAFAHPSNNFVLHATEFREMLRQEGIDSPTMRQALYTLFCAHLHVAEEEGINALCLCKLIELALQDPKLSRSIAMHCFNTLPRELTTRPPCLTHASLDHALERLEAGQKRKKKTRRAQDSKRKANATRMSGTTRTPALTDQLVAVKEMMLSEETDVLDAGGFTVLFLGPHGNTLLPHFVKQIFEVCHHCLSVGTTDAAFPALSSRWMSTIAPVPYSRTAPMDADALLLQEYEQTCATRSKRCK